MFHSVHSLKYLTSMDLAVLRRISFGLLFCCAIVSFMILPSYGFPSIPRPDLESSDIAQVKLIKRQDGGTHDHHSSHHHPSSHHTSGERDSSSSKGSKTAAADSLVSDPPNAHAHHSHGSNDVPMRMYFHSDSYDLLLFEAWITKTKITYIASLIGVVVFASLYSLFLYQFKPWVSFKYLNLHPVSSLASSSSSSTSSSSTPSPMHWTSLELKRIGYSCMHVLEMTYSLLLMLIVMSFNVGWCLAVVLGVGLGTYLFRRGTYYDPDTTTCNKSTFSITKDPRETSNGLCC